MRATTVDRLFMCRTLRQPCQLWLAKPYVPTLILLSDRSPKAAYFASGSGRIWNLTTFGSTPGPPSPLPPSMCHVA